MAKASGAGPQQHQEVCQAISAASSYQQLAYAQILAPVQDGAGL